MLSETGRVTQACEFCGLTKQSTYALRARDPVFAASWDAACELARAQLADALYERAMEGVTETLSKDGEVVAERHRYDSRLSVSVLNRLDRRCDRALESGARHLALVRRWDEWLSLVGKGEDLAAGDLLESANPGQLGQLPLSGNPTGEAEDPQEIDLSDRCWRDDNNDWMTSFPPPPGFDGYETCDWGDPEAVYERECTADEVALLEADAAAALAHERSEEEALRDQWFALLREELDAPPPLNSPQSP